MQNILPSDVKTYDDILKYNENLYIPFRKNALGQEEYLNVLQIKVDLLKEELYKYRNDLEGVEKDLLESIGKRLQKVLLKEKVFPVKDAPYEGDYFITSSPFDENLYSLSTFLDKFCPRQSFYDQVNSSKGRSYDDDYGGVALNYSKVLTSYADDDIIDLRNEYQKPEYLGIHLETGTFIKVVREKERYLYLKDLNPVSNLLPLALEYKITTPTNEYAGLLLDESYITLLNKYAEKALSNYRDDEANVTIQLTSEAFFDTLIQGIETLNGMHSDGKVHGNFYAGCIDFLDNKWVLKDSLNLSIGAVSPSKYDKYFAPEQLLLQPLDERTDIYFIGLVILNYIGAQQFGKTSDYYIPDANGIVKHQILLDEPFVYISPESSIFEGKGDSKNKWRAFLEKCLAFDMNNRFSSVDILLEELNILIEKYPIKKLDASGLGALGLKTDAALLNGEVVYGYDV
ncbi:hypothetical protein [Flammeovirga sp. EKP202]|uniref:hypothetical protein n=1 Tax=Flammeovirga sp. EKP202 TaxID=2770592 RepID=UPI00165FF61C|nr:hypothetical protein [Flammeovirga sp. EKP202]MBD0402943.1 hypothetical protein [Flammeovirga sp. EKP202]